MKSIKNHKPEKVLKVLINHYGFFTERVTGSHYQLRHRDGRRVTVPRHNNRPLKPGVMKSIIMQAKADEQDFLNLI